MAKTIRFNSTPEFWRKEYLGIKPNTIRKSTDSEDVRFEILNDFMDGRWNLIDIEVSNTVTKEEFTRRVTDVSEWDGYYIISWLHSYKR